MKKFKKLIPALCMLLVSAVLVGTSTYAWFSMNETVTVTGLEVTAKSDQTYLIISDTANTVSALQALSGAKNQVTFTTPTGEAAKMLPVKPGTDVTTAAAAADATKWYYEIAASSSAATGDGNQHALTTDNFGKYVIHKTVYMTISKGSVSIADLKAYATFTAENGKIDAARVLLATTVKVGDTTAVDKGVKTLSGTVAQDAAINLVAGTIDDTTLVQVDMYIYLDGEDSTIVTDKFDDLGTAKIEVKFDVVKANA